MKTNRRQFLLFLGATSAVAACNSNTQKFAATTAQTLKFTPVKLPFPLADSEDSWDDYQSYVVTDDLVLPEGYRYDVLAEWGDPVGNDTFGYNNDYVSFIPTGINEGLLTINFEYISTKPWFDSYKSIRGKDLPFADLIQNLKEKGGKVDTQSFPKDDPLIPPIRDIAKAGLQDQGIGIIKIRRQKGRWQREPSNLDRRISGISGLEDGQYIKSTGPATHVFNKTEKLGYDDNLGAQIIGTFQNCAGGTTPWGTVLSAEENVQYEVPEPVKADGSSLAPDNTPFQLSEKNFRGMGNPLGLAGNKYGWMVEVDPSNANDYGTKHTWLGRFRHEAVAFHAEEGKSLAVYSGCDRRGGHLYKFVSEDSIANIKDKANSKLFQKGMLYGAKFNADGTGEWIPIKTDTPINPVLPSQVIAKKDKGLVMLPNPDRKIGGIKAFRSDEDVDKFKQQFKTLGDLYIGNAEEKQGAILIDAHFAGNAAGITCTARPEDTTFDQNQKILFIAFTSGAPDEKNGGPDKSIFVGPNGEKSYEFGWIMKLQEDQQDPGAMIFNWSMFALGGEPGSGGLGFSNPDNLEVDGKGNLWMVTDISTSKHNKEPKESRTADTASTQLRGLFGNNSAWLIPTSGEDAGKAFPFALGPMESELCGLCFVPDQKTLFLTAQHPGENTGQRQNKATKLRTFEFFTETGETIKQDRVVPIGSNWPGGGESDFPKPSLVAVYREDGEVLI